MIRFETGYRLHVMLFQRYQGYPDSSRYRIAMHRRDRVSEELVTLDRDAR